MVHKTQFDVCISYITRVGLTVASGISRDLGYGRPYVPEAENGKVMDIKAMADKLINLIFNYQIVANQNYYTKDHAGGLATG